MASEIEKAKITEIKVRMDCNGCVQKIKKVIHNISGIHDIYIDFPKQKLTVIGWANPEKIVKAIRKTRKTATICSHAEQKNESDTSEATETTQQQDPEAANHPHTEPRASEEASHRADFTTSPTMAAAPQPEPSKEQPPPEKQATDASTPAASENNSKGLESQIRQNDVEEVHVIYPYTPDYSHRNTYWDRYNKIPGGPQELPNIYTASHRLHHEPPRRYAHSPRSLHAPAVAYAHSLRSIPEPAVRYVHNPRTIPEPLVRYSHSLKSVCESPVTYEHSLRSVQDPSARYAHSPGSVLDPSIRYAHAPTRVLEPPVIYAHSQGFSHELEDTQLAMQSKVFQHETQVSYTNTQEQPHLAYATQSYNTYKPSPYVTGYEHTYSPLRYAYHNRRDYTEDYQSSYYGDANGNGNITAMFSDENPNSCMVM